MPDNKDSIDSGSQELSELTSFDTTRNFTLPLPNPDSMTGEDKEVTVNWPTDQHWVRRQRSRVIAIRNLGRGESTVKVEPNEDVSLSIYNQIRLPDSPDLDAIEADFVLDRLSQADVINVTREGGKYIVELDVPGGLAIHSLRCPSLAQVRKYDGSKLSGREGRFGLQRIQVLIEPSADLYDQLTTDPLGKLSPIIHKSAALEAVIQDIKDRMEGKSSKGVSVSANSPNGNGAHSNSSGSNSGGSGGFQ